MSYPNKRIRRGGREIGWKRHPRDVRRGHRLDRIRNGHGRTRMHGQSRASVQHPRTPDHGPSAEERRMKSDRPPIARRPWGRCIPLQGDETRYARRHTRSRRSSRHGRETSMRSRPVPDDATSGSMTRYLRHIGRDGVDMTWDGASRPTAPRKTPYPPISTHSPQPERREDNTCPKTRRP